MRALREDERDEIESVKHFVKYVISRRDAPGWEIFDAMIKVAHIGNKYVMSEIVTEEELSELIDLEDVKEVLSKLTSKFKEDL